MAHLVLSTKTSDNRYRAYLSALNDAQAALEIMQTLPVALEPAKELGQALERVIQAVWALDLPLGDATEILEALSAGGVS